MSVDLSDYQAVLLDLDGTIYREDHALPSAADLVAMLERRQLPYACLSNGEGSAPRIQKRLSAMGIAVGQEHIYTAGMAAVEYVLERFGPTPRVFNLSTSSVRDMLEGRAATVESEDEAADAVILGAPNQSFATFERARIAMLMLRRGASLVATCADRIYPSPRGLEFGAGAFASFVGYAANVQPLFCGKPQRIFFERLCHKLNVDPRRCILIGDNVESDIAGARAMGMASLLLLTGVTHRQDLTSLRPEHRPDFVADDLGELILP